MMKEKLDHYCTLINGRLDELMSVYNENTAKNQLICAEAMKYSLQAGGKRIRPVLVLEFCRILCGDETIALDAACALEMIHTFSLIHDDLPCMDDDDMRRGRPSCHKAFGEATALLAGDALENYAFEVIASDEKLTAEQKVMLIKTLSEAVGVLGMIGGQIIDIDNTDKVFDGGMLLDMYSMKTGALIRCACRMGCICAGKHMLCEKADAYADALGLAFQIVDDILDITADENLLGKPVHSDEGLNKATYPAVFGLEASVKKAEKLTADAMNAASVFESSFLTELTGYLLKRKY